MNPSVDGRLIEARDALLYHSRRPQLGFRCQVVQASRDTPFAEVGNISATQPPRPHVRFTTLGS